MNKKKHFINLKPYVRDIILTKAWNIIVKPKVPDIPNVIKYFSAMIV